LEYQKSQNQRLARNQQVTINKSEVKQKNLEDEEISVIEDENEQNQSHEGEESEKEEQSESEPSIGDEIDYVKPEYPAKKRPKYFEKIKVNRDYENKILLINYQYQDDYEFFLKKLYYLYTLKPKLVIISYNDKENILRPLFMNKLAEINDVRVVLVKQSDKEGLIETMTYITGKRMNKKRILDGILVSSKILYNTVVYSWG